MPDGLRLEVREFTGLTRWRWTLTDASGAFLADHEVRLDPHDEQFEAFTALHDYVSWHAAPDKRLDQGGRIVTGLGDWIGAEVFGPAIGDALLQHESAIVEVILPPGAEALAYLPLEAARVQGDSLVGHDVTLVICPPAEHAPPTAPGPQRTPRPGDRLRVLGLFSLPEGGSALNLRRERQSLVRLIRGIAADIRVLQYGVTRDRLRGILQEAEGWDVIHLSGHGAPGELVLETAAGHPDRISAADLADLLDTARGRVKLVTLSACWSAALTAAGQRRLLGLPAGEDQDHHPERIVSIPPPPGALATELTSRLGCAVLAMRFPVGDEFAIELSAKLYDLLVRQGESLPRAVALALSHLTYQADRRFPALSMAAPAIFGATAATLTLKAPERTGPVSHAAGNLKMAGFPPQPDRFVGRTAVMARSSAALAAGSRAPGVLLHGMPGGGKTACALELAYTHEHAFDHLVWFKAPDEGTAIDTALNDLALTLERDLPGFQMIHVLDDEAELTAFLPTLTQLLKEGRVLIVIDNAESLLTDTGQWRDQQWAKIFGALTGHNGPGRVIVTTRRVPGGTSDTNAGNAPAGARSGLDLAAEPVDALTADEALLLARELPNLRALIYGGLPGLDRATARKLARGVLTVTQGHPKLLELADGQAANPRRLAALTEAGDQAWRDQGGLPEGFFTSGETTTDPGGYLHVLAAWTKIVTDTLSPGERDLFRFLCCLEEPDRERSIVKPLWPNLWRELGRDGQPPGLDRALAELAARGLTAKRPVGGNGESYYVHPGVAAAGRDHAGHGFQATVDTEAADYWDAVYRSASGENGDDGSVHTAVMVRAGLAAVPYLIRREQWNRAAYLLERAFLQNPSRASARALLPAITRITDHDSSHAGVLALVLQPLNPAAAEARLRAHLEEAGTRGDYRAAAAAAGHLSYRCQDTGRLDEALTFTDRLVGYTRKAGLGPWTQLAGQEMRLRILAAMGRDAGQILDEVLRLRRRMDTLPDRPDPDEAVDSWNVRETLLSTGRHAALQLGRWQDALDLSAEITASEQASRAPVNAIARTRFHDYYPLLRLGRADDALALLRDCRQIFEYTDDTEMLGKTFGALAETEGERGRGDAVIGLQRDALRYTYRADNVPDIPTIYHNLGISLRLHARQPAVALAAHLAAALIRALIGMDGTEVGSAADSVSQAVNDLRVFGSAAEPPADVADLCRRLADFEGTSLSALIRRLSFDSETTERALRNLITTARELAKPPTRRRRLRLPSRRKR